MGYEERICNEWGDGRGVTACATCNGESLIYRPVKEVVMDVERKKYNASGLRLDSYVVSETIEIGGLDACPHCAVIAEFQFNGMEER